MWFLLLRQGQPVGYRKRVGSLEMFSSDGYAFQGTRIPYDQAFEETPLRTLAGERVFDGDVVELRPRPDAEFEQRVVVIRDGKLVAAPPKSAQWEELQPQWTELRSVPVRARVGSIHAGSFYARLFEPALGALSERGLHHWGPALRWALAVLAGGAAGATSQYALLGAVGPLGVCFGAGLGVFAAALYESRGRGRRLRPAFLSRVGLRAASVNAALLALLYLSASGTGVLRVGPEARGVGILAAAALGWLTTFALALTVGSALDHYLPGEDEGEPRA